MNISPLLIHCKSLGLDFPDRLYSHIEKSIEDGRYSLEQAVAWTTEKANEYRDLMQYRDLFKSQTSVDSIKDIPSLKQYADELRIKIPDETMKKMEQSVKDGKLSPSELANYLRGTAYEHFLQSKNVPSLSEADHTHLKTTLGPENYKLYAESLAAVSKKTGLTEPALDQIADKLFHDKAKAMKLYSDAISNVSIPELQSQPESVIAYAKKVGVDMPPPRANLLCDLQLDKDELKKHIIHLSFETFSEMDRSFSKRLNTQLKPNTITSIDYD
jgi:hypothetical protein